MHQNKSSGCCTSNHACQLRAACESPHESAADSWKFGRRRDKVSGAHSFHKTEKYFKTTNIQVFQVFMDSLFQSFNQQVSMNNFAELSGCVFSWIEERCKPGDLQVPCVSNYLGIFPPANPNYFELNVVCCFNNISFQDLMSLILRTSGKDGEPAVQEPIDPAYQRMWISDRPAY